MPKKIGVDAPRPLPRTAPAERPSKPSAAQVAAAPGDAFVKPVDAAGFGKATKEDVRAVADVAKLAIASAKAISGDDAWGDITAQLQRIKALDQGPRRNITILGAGMAGLAAAHELEKLGHHVRVLEGNDRLGGRVLTHRFKDGTYHELGAMRIPASHDYTRHYIDELGLKLRTFISAGQETDALYDIDGVKTHISDAQAELYPHFKLSPEDLQAKTPGDMLDRHVSALVKSLTQEEKASLFSTELSTERLRKLDQTSLEQFLRDRGEGDDAIRLIGIATGLEPEMNKPMTNTLREELRKTGEGLEEIAGGMDQLPKGLAAKLKTPIEFGTKVLGMRTREDGKVELKLSKNGSAPYTELDDEVISTLPFPVMRQIDTPDFSSSKTFAIRNMEYGSATKVLLDVKERFWEEQGVFGGSSDSDRLSGQTYYPSDNAVKQDAAVSHGPGTLVGSYVWGAQARAEGAMDPKDRVQAVVDSVARFHPELKEPGMVKDAATIAWDQNPWSGGAYGEPGVGQHALYKAAIAPEGNVHFAGEHTSLDQGWIQGALISALRAVEEIVTEKTP